MSAPDRTNASAICLSLGALLGYAAAYFFGLPKPIYLPVEGAWTFAPGPESITMGWYGLMLWGLAGAVVALPWARLSRVQAVCRRPWVMGVVLALLVASMLGIAGTEFVHWILTHEP